MLKTVTLLMEREYRENNNFYCVLKLLGDMGSDGMYGFCTVAFKIIFKCITETLLLNK